MEETQNSGTDGIITNGNNEDEGVELEENSEESIEIEVRGNANNEEEEDMLVENSLSSIISSTITEMQSQYEADLEKVRKDLEAGCKETNEADVSINKMMEEVKRLLADPGSNQPDSDPGEDLDSTPAVTNDPTETQTNSKPAAASEVAPVSGFVIQTTQRMKPKIVKKVVEPRSYTPPPPKRGQNSLDSPPISHIIRGKLSKDTEVWAQQSDSLLEPWMKATVLKVKVEKTVNNKTRQILFHHHVKVRFVDGTIKDLTGKNIALTTEVPVRLPVGTRVIALYKEEGSEEAEDFYPAVVAETPKNKNKNRYLVFFDDQYPSYVSHKELRLVYTHDHDVWKDVDVGLRGFLKEYMLQYPDRPMLNLKEDDKVKTKLNGKFVDATINWVDASLAQVSFSEDVCEWVYRGSPRFEPIFKNQTALLKKRMMGEVLPVNIDTMEHQEFVEHNCDPRCGDQYKYIAKNHRTSNPLRIPIHLGWRRLLCSFDDKENNVVLYVAPCGRRCRNLEEVQEYLTHINSKLEIDFFAFEPWLNVMMEFRAGPDLIQIRDLSNGKETMPIPAANSIDSTYPKMINYSLVPIPQKNVNIVKDPGFLVRCDCDNKTRRCDDNMVCACRQLTMRETTTNELVGYRHRRLPLQVPTGIYECNKECSCSSTCPNRLAQFPIRTRLQVFKTKNRGWGIRALDDIPQGSFVCTYVGKLYADSESQVQGKEFGDTYFCELDFIEVAEGYLKPDLNLNKAEGLGSDDEEEERQSKDDNKNPVKTSKNETETESELRENGSVKEEDEEEREKEMKINSVRRRFGEEETEPYVMDANTQGNIGRFFNHSCSPNIFVQNVFIDSHDLRFPTLAFFTMKFVGAGEELCWDYGYGIDAVQGKQIICNCGAALCRGRLL